MDYLAQLWPLYLLLYLLVFIFGMVIGSFVNVLIYRLPQGESFIRGRSHCPACNRQLRAVDLLPVFSYIFLRGRCRYCGAKISPRYPLVELISGVAAVLSLGIYGVSWSAAAVFALIAGLIAIAFIDWDTMEIPNGLVIYLFIPAIALCFFLPDVSWPSHLIGFFAVSLPLLLLATLIKGSFGGGDIKMMAACGLALGWQLSLVALFIALLTGGAYGIYLLRGRKSSGKAHMPFGPYLALGVAVALLWGRGIWQWYLALFAV